MTTGEGGMVTTNNEELANKIKIYGLHGMSKDAWKRFSDEGYKHYQVLFPGFKYNMMDIQAALGIHQLARIEKNLARRNQIWQVYDRELADLPVILPAAAASSTIHSRHLYTLLIKTEEIGRSRDYVLNELIKRNIGAGVHYTPLHLHDYYQKTFGYRQGDFPNTEYIGDRTISIPLSAKLSDDDVEDVIYALKTILS
jgi:dTDP-4-amino-4,6-dideoxygalactose transaminase